MIIDTRAPFFAVFVPLGRVKKVLGVLYYGAVSSFFSFQFTLAEEEHFLPSRSGLPLFVIRDPRKARLFAFSFFALETPFRIVRSFFR